MLADVNLLHTNSVQYNGESHSITAIAAKIVQTCKEQFDEHADQFDALEANLQQQGLVIARTSEQLASEDDWQDLMATDPTAHFDFNPLLEGRKTTSSRENESSDHLEPNICVSEF